MNRWNRLIALTRAQIAVPVLEAWRRFNRFWPQGITPVIAIATVLASGLFFLTFGRAILGVNSDVSMRVVDGDYLGTLPQPVSPSLFDPLANLFRRAPDYKLMVIRRIPPIVTGSGMPHPYVGACTNCHLYVDGPGPGTQYKTPVGALLEQLSRLHKLGPPIWPNADIPHPPAGRCIKCHDIVVKLPVEQTPGGFIWKF
ncbi:MAG: magnetochrome domain-containing protein [Rhodospirillaceae bacterium]